MQKKIRNINLKVFILILFLFLPIIFFLQNIELSKTKSNVIQYIMSFDLGFSGRKNLVDEGQGVFANDMQEGFSIYKNRIVSEIIKSIPSIILYKSLNQSNFQNLYINVSLKNLKIIENDKKNAVKFGALDDPKFVNANIVFNGKTLKAKLRLKGDQLGHFKTNRRNSFRIHLSNKKTIMSLNKFSIQKPSERQFPYNHVFQKFMRNLGNISPKDEYVRVIFNGVSWGVMNIEEHISTELLEKQKRKDSLVFRFGNEKNWKKNNNQPLYLISDPSINFNVYNEKETFKNINNRKVFSYLLETNILNNPNIYDFESFSNAFIGASIWGNYHTILNNNTRYYFNPYLLKLELITTDQLGFKTISNLNDLAHAHLPDQFKTLLKDKKFNSYLENKFIKLKNTDLNLQKYFNEIKFIFPIDKIKKTNFYLKNLSFIDSNFNYLNDFLTNDKNTNYIDTLTTDDIINFDQYLNFRHYDNGEIEIFNFIPRNIIIKDILLNNKSYLNQNIILPSYKEFKQPFKIKTEIYGLQDKKIRVIAEYEGVQKEAINTYTLYNKKIKNPLVFNQDDYNHNLINKVSDFNYVFKVGNHKITSPIKIKGNLIIPHGVKLQFSKDSYLLVHGSLNIRGIDGDPVIIEPILDNWKGIYVYNSIENSSIKNTIINNTNYTNDGLLNLTGGITFYNSQLSIQNLSINGSLAEDALNIVNSKFAIENLILNNSHSDGIDLDFSDGKISNSKFNSIGGDAIDFSGSNVDVLDVIINEVKDKGISVGENSNIDIHNSLIQNANVGLVSKDGSKTILKNSVIKNYNKFSVMSYYKKNFYSAPSLFIENSEIGNEESIMRQNNTKMKIDKINVIEKKFNVNKFYNN